MLSMHHRVMKVNKVHLDKCFVGFRMTAFFADNILILRHLALH